MQGPLAGTTRDSVNPPVNKLNRDREGIFTRVKSDIFRSGIYSHVYKGQRSRSMYQEPYIRVTRQHTHLNESIDCIYLNYVCDVRQSTIQDRTLDATAFPSPTSPLSNSISDPTDPLIDSQNVLLYSACRLFCSWTQYRPTDPLSILVRHYPIYNLHPCTYFHPHPLSSEK